VDYPQYNSLLIPPLVLVWGYMKIHNVAQGTGEWLRLRLGMITGTRLKSVMGGKQAQKTLVYELVAEQLSGRAEELYRTPAMQWGTDHEAEAVELYEEQTGVKTEEVGFCVSKKMTYLGLSPDRLIKRGKKYVKGVEVKCPSTKVAVKYRAEGGIPSEYKWQVINYFLVCEDMQELDFVVYDPRIIRPELKLHIATVTREDLQEDIDAAKKRLESFRDDWRLVWEKLSPDVSEDVCPTCNNDRGVEVIGDGDNFEVDVIDYKPCPDCEYEDVIQD